MQNNDNEEDGVDTGTAAQLSNIFSAPGNYVLLLHLSHLLPVLNRFNKLFQRRVPQPHYILRKLRVLKGALQEGCVDDASNWYEAIPLDACGVRLRQYLQSDDCTLTRDQQE